jgi:hypothetical protein
VLVRARGFDHVSDDDFARVTIAQDFAHAPRLDPSGTSWLPFPFWLLGSALAGLGRSLDAARTLSVLFAAIAAPLPYVAMRAVAVPRAAALAGTGLALATPWSLWLGASTVPESFTASAAAAAAIVLGASSAGESARRRTLAWGAAAASLACLSRYEPWPIAFLLAAAVAVRGARAGNRALLAVAALAVAGPLAWMAWNAHAHGSALHFVERVARYRRAVGQGAGDDLGAALSLYPRLFLRTRPELVLAFCLAIPLLRRPDVRARWAVPLACVFAQMAFLAYGAARDGAPTHHAERPLLASFVLVACFTTDAAWTAWGAPGSLRSRAGVALGAALVAVLTAAGLRHLAAPPGATAWEDRTAQLAQGASLRAAPSLVVVPCAYEHFALVAAYGAPERVTVLERTGEPPSPDCPRVTHAERR